MRNIFRTILILSLLAGIAANAGAQAPMKQGRLGPINSPANSYIDLRGTGVTVHSMFWYVDGTLTGCMVQLVSPASNSTLISAQSCTSTSTAPVTASGFVNDAEIEVTAISGTGTLRVFYEGDNSSSSSGMADNIQALLDAATNPDPNQVLGTVNAQASQGSFTDRSGTVTTGGTSQQLAASNASRHRLIVENRCSAALENISAVESLMINFTSNATTGATGSSIEIPPCSVWDSAAGAAPVSTEQVNVTAATTNHSWVAKEQ